VTSVWTVAKSQFNIWRQRAFRLSLRRRLGSQLIIFRHQPALDGSLQIDLSVRTRRRHPKRTNDHVCDKFLDFDALRWISPVESAMLGFRR
jgi:hypothetical protein